MKPRTHVAFVIWVWVASAAWPPPPARGAESPPSGVLAGIVLDGSGEPVEGARVLAFRDPAPPGAPQEVRLATLADLEALLELSPVDATSGADGRFSFLALEPRWYTIRVLSIGSSAVELPGVRVPRVDLSFTLEPATAVEIGAIDAVARLPIADATISVYRAPRADADVLQTLLSKARLPLEAWTTDPEGVRRFELLGVGTYDIVARAPGYREASRLGVELDGSIGRVELRLDPGRSISGVVTGPDHKPVDGATVSVHAELVRGELPERPVDVRFEDAGTTTGADGRFSFDTLRGGQHTLIVHHPDFVSRRLSGIASDARDLGVSLARGIVLSGTVVDARTGRGVEGAAVSVRDISRYRKRAITDADGGFSVRSPLSADVSMEVTAEGYATLRRELMIRTNVAGPVPITLELQRPGAVEGDVVRSDGRPVPWAVVSVYRVDERVERLLSFGETAADGTFRIEGLEPAERIRVCAHLEGFIRGCGGEFALNPGSSETVRIVLRRGGTLAGRVLDGRGEGFEGTRVSLRPPGRAASISETSVDSNGRYVIENVPPGEYELIVSSVGHFDAIQPVEVREADVVQVGDITPRAGNVFSGRIVDASGKPVVDADVIVRWVEGVGGEVRTASVIGGEFHALGVVSTTTVEVAVVHPEYAPVLGVEFPVDRAGIEIELVRLPILRGRLEHPHGRLARSFTVQPVEIRPLGKLVYLRKLRVQSDDGSFEYRGIPEGRYRLRLRAGGLSGIDVEDLAIGSEPVVDLGAIRLETLVAGPAVAGVVLHEGEPVEGATVRILEGSAAFSSSRVSPQATTDLDGVFGFLQMRASGVTIEVTHSDFAPARLEGVSTLKPDSLRLEIELLVTE